MIKKLKNKFKILRTRHKIFIGTAVILIAAITAVLITLPAQGDSVNLYALAGQGTATTGTATITGSPLREIVGTRNIVVTTTANNQTFTMTMCSGTSATIVSGTATVTGTVTCAGAAATTVTVTNTITNGTLSITVTYATPALWSSKFAWSTLSGGTPALASHVVPTSTNPVFFDANSFGGTSETFQADVAAQACASIDFTGVTNDPTFSGSTTFYTYGNVTLQATGTMEFTRTGTWSIRNTSGTASIHSAGWTLPCGFTITGVGGAMQLDDNLSMSGANVFTLQNGAFSTNGKSLTQTGTVTISGTAARTFNMSGSTVTCGIWTATTTTLLTFTTDATSKIVVTSAGPFASGSLTNYNEVDINASGTTTFTGSPTIAKLVAEPSVTQSIRITDGETITITDAANTHLSGSSGHVHTLRGSTATGAWNLTCASGTIFADWVAITYNTAAGGATFDCAVNGTFDANTTGWTQLPDYWVGNSGNWTNINQWANTSGGTAGTGKVPTTTTSVRFDANSFTTGSQIVTVDTATQSCLNMDWTGTTNSPVWAKSAALNIYGNGTYILNMSSNSAGNYPDNYVGTGKTITTNGASLAHRFAIGTAAVSASITLVDGINTSTVFYLTCGTLNMANQTITCSSFSDGAGSYNKTLTMGSGTLNCTSWSFPNAGLTITAAGNTSTINCTGQFSGGAPTGSYYDINLNGLTSIVSGAFTCRILTRNGTAAGGNTITFTSGVTTTCTTCAMKGNSVDYPLRIYASTNGTPATITATNWTGTTNVGIKDITATNAVNLSGITGTCVNFGGNANITFKTKMTQRRIAKILGLI